MLEQLDPLARDLERQEGAAGEVAAGPRQALGEPRLNRIPADGVENGNVLDRPRRPDRRETGHDEGDL